MQMWLEREEWIGHANTSEKMEMSYMVGMCEKGRKRHSKVSKVCGGVWGVGCGWGGVVWGEQLYNVSPGKTVLIILCSQRHYSLNSGEKSDEFLSL